MSTETPSRRPNHDRRNYDEFRESLAAPGRTYRSAIEPDDRVSLVERIIRYAALVLGFLLAMRFLVSLFTGNVANPIVNFFRATTNWVVSPFQTVIGRPPTGTGGFFDWPALVALIVVALLSLLILGLLRPRTDY
jgi:uncharacterized protein YggT (Ycf19 family)